LCVFGQNIQPEFDIIANTVSAAVEAWFAPQKAI